MTNATGNIIGENRYYPYGETRLTTGTILTDKLFTGQREMAGLGIYHYGARFYSPKLGRFLSPDSIVPGATNPQNLNRYSYVTNNPLRYTDPTGHRACGDGEAIDCDGNSQDPNQDPNPYEPPNDDPNDPTDDVETGPMPGTYSGGTCDANCIWERILSGPDYVVGSIGIPLLSFIPIVGPFIPIQFQLIRDYYNNWYFGIGISISNPGVSGSLAGGYLLQSNRPEEYVLESFISTHTVSANGGLIVGGGGTWGDPSFTRQQEVEDVALEAGGFYPAQGTLEYVFGIPIYDAGNSQPLLPWLLSP